MKSSARAVRQNASKTARTGTSRAAIAAWQSGTLAFAEAQWRAALLRNPDDLPALRALSDIVHQAGRHEEAARLLRSFARTAAGIIPIWAFPWQTLGRHEEAEAAYRQGHRPRSEPSPSAHLNLGNLLQKQRRDTEAEAAFRAALDASHRSTQRPGMVWAKRCNARAGIKEALEAFRQAVAMRACQCRSPLQSGHCAVRAGLQRRSAGRTATRR